MVSNAYPDYKLTPLGILICNKIQGRIIAMPTSEVYSDAELISKHLKIPKSNLDNGIQAHLYVEPEDGLVVFFPHLSKKLLMACSGMLGIASATGELRTRGDSLMVPRDSPRLRVSCGWPLT